jgi:predicted transcriptional regulator
MTDLPQLLWFLVAGARGGPNRIRILEALKERPSNAHQLAVFLELDYRTIRYHLRLLERHGLVTHPSPSAYGAPYFLTPYLEANFGFVAEVRARLASRPLASFGRVSPA